MARESGEMLASNDENEDTVNSLSELGYLKLFFDCQSKINKKEEENNCQYFNDLED